jgi:gas vesicle protein
MTNESSTKSFLLGALLGGLASAAAALLLAPKSGKQMRKDLCSACDEISKKAEQLVKETTDEAKGSAEELTEDVKEKAKEGAKHLKK